MKFFVGLVSTLFCLTGCENSNDNVTTNFRTDLTVDEIMHLVLEPSADVLWDSAGFVITVEGEESLAPTTEEGWFAVESAAGVVQESGNLLLIPVRSENRADWIQFTNQMVDVAAQARTAALNQDERSLFQAGADLYQTCVSCHTRYWVQEPDIE